MGTVVEKIRCPNPEHVDENPSCALYADGSAYCFVCLRAFANVADPVTAAPKPKEDIDATIKYIAGLPKQAIRGLELPFDSRGYYVVWPSGDYYKRRNWGTVDECSRYYSPTGHRKPVFDIGSGTDISADWTIVVEGEINALSIQAAGVKARIISPGSASDMQGYEPVGLTERVLVLVDQDAPGLQAGWAIKRYLEEQNSFVHLELMEDDANDVLKNYGRQTLQKKIESYLS